MMARVGRIVLGATLLLAAGCGGVALLNRSAPAPTPVVSSPAPEASAEDTLVIEVAGHITGTVEIALRPDIAPNHVARIKQLARDGAYDGIVFHRVIEGFMAQTGDVQFGQHRGGNAERVGTGGSDLPDLKAEFSDVLFQRGIVGMARASSPDSANSQFFIMFKRNGSLDSQYTVVGRVVSGMAIMDAITRGSGPGGAVEEPDYMASVRVKADM